MWQHGNCPDSGLNAVSRLEIAACSCTQRPLHWHAHQGNDVKSQDRKKGVRRLIRRCAESLAITIHAYTHRIIYIYYIVYIPHVWSNNMCVSILDHYIYSFLKHDLWVSALDPDNRLEGVMLCYKRYQWVCESDVCSLHLFQKEMTLDLTSISLFVFQKTLGGLDFALVSRLFYFSWVGLIYLPGFEGPLVDFLFWFVSFLLATCL